MSRIIPTEVKKLWEIWDLRFLILVSLSLQIFLVFFATLRKKSASIRIITCIWSAYLLADWVAAVTVGLISSSQGTGGSAAELIKHGDLLAFWAPFLLLHLGGPDNITSFSLEDNELWLRHLLGLILQVGAAVYVFFQSLPDNKVWIPTTLVLLAGIIKYAERTRALYLASLDHFGDSSCRKPNPGPEYERVQQMYNALKSAHLPARAILVPGFKDRLRGIKYKEEEELTDLDDKKSLLRYAFGFFEIFKGLIPGLLISSQVRQMSRDFFLNRTAEDGFKLVEIELSLMYEVLHTKVVVVRCPAGRIFRLISSVSVAAAFLVFCFVDKQSFRSDIDVRLTYVLFSGALILDAMSVFTLLSFDRALIELENWWGKYVAPTTAALVDRPRWSESIYQLNFMSYCLKDFRKWTNVAQLFWAGGLIDKLKIAMLMSHEQVSAELRKFIFTELRRKSLKAENEDDIRELCSSRGVWALQQSFSGGGDGGGGGGGGGGCRQLNWSVVDVEYTESLLLWHIATEFCYKTTTSGGVGGGGGNSKEKEISKLLSDYGFYVVVTQPTIMTPVSGNFQMVFQDTCAEAKRFFRKRSYSNEGEACAQILSVKAELTPGAVKGDASKSVLFDACILAEQLLYLGEQNRWEVVRRVWLELLCYAAVNCNANVHAQQLSKGGELLTVIWLLMNHLGLGNQFYEANAARIKFIVNVEIEKRK